MLSPFLIHFAIGGTTRCIFCTEKKVKYSEIWCNTGIEMLKPVLIVESSCSNIRELTSFHIGFYKTHICYLRLEQS